MVEAKTLKAAHHEQRAGGRDRACRCDRRRHRTPCRPPARSRSRLSTRKASTTMSCVAEAVATRSAPSATTSGDADGSQRPRKTIAAISKIATARASRAAGQTLRQYRHVERIDQRRPEELYRVGRADQREQADGAEIDAALAHPDQQRRARQRERQARRETEEHDDQHAPLEIDRERIGDGCAERSRDSVGGMPAAGMRALLAGFELAQSAGMTFELAEACFAAICAPSSTCWMRSPWASILSIEIMAWRMSSFD